MVHRTLLVMTCISGLMCVILAAWTIIACATGSHRRDLVIWHHDYFMSLSGGRTTEGTAACWLSTTNKGVNIYRIGLTPVVSRPGPDGKPLAGLFDPVVQGFSVRLLWIVVGCVATSLLPIIWFIRQPHRKVLRGFPLD